jgi:hypothetical protein
MTFNVDALVAATDFFYRFLQCIKNTNHAYEEAIFPGETQDIQMLMMELEEWDAQPG